MSDVPQSPRLFGDLLALARLHWVHEMGARLGELGYSDYRRSDAILLRQLLDGSVPLGRLGAPLAVTRQAARKVVDGLVERQLALVSRDPDDARRLRVELTASGRDYARAVVRVVSDLNDHLVADVAPADLAAARAVLQTVVTKFG